MVLIPHELHDTQCDVCLYIDIMYVNGMPFLTTINRILSRESKSFMSCSHMNCCLPKHTTYQSTYFIDYFIHGIIKNPRINKMLYLHQKIHTKQFILFCLTCFVFVIQLN